MRIGPSMSRLRTWFLQGIALLAPLIITLAFLVWLGRSVEVVVGELLRQVLPAGWYLPGMGLATGAVLTLAAGLLANLFLVRWLLTLAERLLDRIPVVKSLFQGLKDVSRLLSRDGGQPIGRPVTVELHGVRLVGFVMQEQALLPEPEGRAAEPRIAVYLPMSYQVGGYTLYLDRSAVRPLEVGREDALRAVLTGGSLAPERAGAGARAAAGDEAAAPEARD